MLARKYRNALPSLITALSLGFCVFEVASADAQSIGGDVQIQLIAFDRVVSHQSVGHYDIEGFSGGFPDLIFQILNNSNNDIRVTLDQCDFIKLRFPERVAVQTFRATKGFRAKKIASLTGTALMMPVGPSVVRVSPGQQKYISYGIGDVLAPSFEARQRGTSTCTFQVGGGSGNFLRSRVIGVSSPGRFFSDN